MILILMRGWPGSGKSTAAQKIKNFFKLLNYNVKIFSTDDYFINEKTGEYEFNSAFLKRAHQWNQYRTKKAMEKHTDVIIIDNTNLKLWEMKPYLEMAIEYGYSVYEYVCSGNYQNIHGVPKEKIEQMKNSLEKSNLIPLKMIVFGI